MQQRFSVCFPDRLCTVANDDHEDSETAVDTNLDKKRDREPLPSSVVEAEVVDEDSAKRIRIQEPPVVEEEDGDTPPG